MRETGKDRETNRGGEGDEGGNLQNSGINQKCSNLQMKARLIK